MSPTRAPRTPSSHQPRTRTGLITDAIAGVAGLAAVFAPATFTGHAVIDAVERAVVVAVVTFVGAHARRWSWLVGGALVALPARGASAVIALAGLAVLVAGLWPKRRSRLTGAVGIGLVMNGAMWLPPDSLPWGLFGAVAASTVLVLSGLQYVRSSRRRAVRIGVALLAVVVVLGGVALGATMALAYRDVRDGGDAARRALGAARDGDADATGLALLDATEAFDRAESTVTGPLSIPARIVPGLAQQLEAVTVTVQQGAAVTSTADDIASTADYDELQYDGRLDLVQVEDLVEPTERARDALAVASVQLDDVLDGFLLPPLRSRLEDLTEEIDGAARDTELASTFLEVTPGLFGAEGERHYLIVFVTPAELRGAGGFIGSWAELTAVDGEVDLTRSGRIAELIQARPRGERTLSGPEDYLRRYGRFDPQDFLQDTTFSPHFPSSAQVIAELYPQSGGQPVDGVIGVDPTGLAALLELTGPVTVEGLPEPLTAENAVEVLTKTQYIDLPDDAERGDILTEATRVTFDKLLDASLPSPRRLATVLSPVARSGHLRVWSPTEAEQEAFELVGADGSLVVPEGADGLSVVQQNTGNNKIDAYLQRTIDYRPTIDAATGELTATLRIHLRNEVPSLDLPGVVVANSRGVPLGTNLGWLTIFTPHQVTSASLDGEPITLGPSVERGLNGWDTPLIAVPPGGEAVLEVQLSGGVDLTDGYQLALLPQPVANPDRFSARLAITDGTDADTGAAEVDFLDDEAVTAPWTETRRIDR
ncbi:MAG: DUF4012 domain-containing protein [Acidimicrobiales bacterium]|nr:DUF4012 domain-containing protein [Acidimicrobiales bacterium]